ncbi:MAG: DUF1194 domain-containing protein [Ahrensia sp.]
MTTLFRLMIGLFCLVAAIMPAAAQPARCGLSLVLAMDASSSVDAREYSLQMNGLAAALVDEEVLQAIADVGGVQLYAFEWNGRYNQKIIVPWSYLYLPGDVLDAATQFQNHERGREDLPTALGYALGHASTALKSAPLACARKVIDVSGDGVNNEGFEPVSAYANFDFDEVQVNGLVIAGELPDPVAYYRKEVLFGPGAFVEIANGFEDYEAAMKRKLVREIRGAALSMLQ